MSSQDVGNARGWRADVNKTKPPLENKIGLTAAITGAENSNLDWIEKRTNPPVPGGSSTGSQKSNPAPDPVQFATLRQSMDDSARAAGATRTGNDADLLGFVRPRRLAGQARRILEL